MLNTQAQLSCNICNKSYSRKSSLDKHKILCEFKHKTKNQIQVETEEASDIPNHLQLVKIVQELTLKLIKMEEKMEELQKYVDKKKKKINAINWLNTNTNIQPIQCFKEWTNNSIYVQQIDIENLMINSLCYTFQKIFESQINLENKEYNYPIKSFQQKQNILYIYELDETGNKQWRQMHQEDFVIILKVIQHGLIGELSKWKTTNKDKFDESDKISDLFNKAVIKLMNLSFTPDNNYSKIRNHLYNHVKIDLKAITTEFEFEF
jgi:hypothetical protein